MHGDGGGMRGMVHARHEGGVYIYFGGDFKGLGVTWVCDFFSTCICDIGYLAGYVIVEKRSQQVVVIA